MRNLEDEIKVLLVESLTLEDVRPEDIASDAPLFGKGLGLDSIDALELAMALTRRYRIKFDGSESETQSIFASVRSLAAHIGAHLEAAEAG